MVYFQLSRELLRCLCSLDLHHLGRIFLLLRLPPFLLPRLPAAPVIDPGGDDI